MANLRRDVPFAAALMAVVLAGQWLPAADAQTGSGAGPLTKAQWREDVRHFARELPKRHKNLYHATSQEQFARAVAELDAAIPSLQDHQIVVRLQQIAATVGDGHTGVQLPSSFKRYPINLYWFGRELRVIAAGKEYQSALGTRVVKIGGLGIDEVQARIVSCFPSAANENEWYVMSTSPAFIVRPEVLHALGIVPHLGRASFTFEDGQGQQLTLEISPVAVPPPVAGVVTLGLLPAAKQQPLYRQKPGEPFWFTQLPDAQTTYVSWRRYQSLGDPSRALFAFIDKNNTTRLVIDMRQNGGGDFFEGRKHLVSKVKERPALYSENDEMTLPHSRIVVSYSTRYYKFLEEDIPAVMPDKRIDPSWPEFLAGRDPVMDWIMASASSAR